MVLSCERCSILQHRSSHVPITVPPWRAPCSGTTPRRAAAAGVFVCFLFCPCISNTEKKNQPAVVM
jgi:hypothetical protein